MVLLLLKLKKNIVARMYIFTLEIVKLFIIDFVDKQLFSRRNTFFNNRPTKKNYIYIYDRMLSSTKCFDLLRSSSGTAIHIIFIIDSY
jgi:hypothetical protein